MYNKILFKLGDDKKRKIDYYKLNIFYNNLLIKMILKNDIILIKLKKYDTHSNITLQDYTNNSILIKNIFNTHIIIDKKNFLNYMINISYTESLDEILAWKELESIVDKLHKIKINKIKIYELIKMFNFIFNNKKLITKNNKFKNVIKEKLSETFLNQTDKSTLITYNYLALFHIIKLEKIILPKKNVNKNTIKFENNHIDYYLDNY